MPVPASINDLSTTASNNSPAGSESPTTTDDYLRALSSFIAILRDFDASAYNKANALGTVSQSGGIPTGAIIERGRNANGEYVRYADGTQICTMTVVTAAINDPFGGLYRSGVANFTFPAAFASIPCLSAVCETSGLVWASGRATSTTAGQVNLWYVTSISGANSAQVTAIGRWY